MSDDQKEEILETVKAILANPEDYQPLAGTSGPTTGLVYGLCQAFRDSVREKLALEETCDFEQWCKQQEIGTWEQLARFVWRHQVRLADDLSDEVDDLTGQAFNQQGTLKRIEDRVRSLESLVQELASLNAGGLVHYRAPVDQPG